MRHAFSNLFWRGVVRWSKSRLRDIDAERKDPWHEIKTDYLGILSTVIVACMIGYWFIYVDTGPQAGASDWAVGRFLGMLGPTVVVLFVLYMLLQVSVSITLIVGVLGGIGYLLYRMF